MHVGVIVRTFVYSCVCARIFPFLCVCVGARAHACACVCVCVVLGKIIIMCCNYTSLVAIFVKSYAINNKAINS